MAAYAWMMLAASETTNSLAETEICRFSDVFRPSRALYMDSVNARSFVALGAMSATLKTCEVGVEVVEPPGAAVVVVAAVLLPHAAAASATPIAATSTATFLVRCACIVMSFLFGLM